MIPMARENARVVVVSSNFALRAMFQVSGDPNKYSNLNEIEQFGRKLFSTNGSILSPLELDKISKKFINDWKASDTEGSLWPDHKMTPIPGYDMSKLLINNLVRYYSQQNQLKSKNIVINGVCPGFCGTDLNSMIAIDKPTEPHTLNRPDKKKMEETTIKFNSKNIFSIC